MNANSKETHYLFYCFYVLFCFYKTIYLLFFFYGNYENGLKKRGGGSTERNARMVHIIKYIPWYTFGLILL